MKNFLIKINQLPFIVGFFYYFFTKYYPEKTSLINDKVSVRYGYLKYPYTINHNRKAFHYSNDYRYGEYDSRRYYKYPMPMWFNKLYFNYLIK